MPHGRALLPAVAGGSRSNLVYLSRAELPEVNALKLTNGAAPIAVASLSAKERLSLGALIEPVADDLQILQRNLNMVCCTWCRGISI